MLSLIYSSSIVRSCTNDTKIDRFPENASKLFIAITSRHLRKFLKRKPQFNAQILAAGMNKVINNFPPLQLKEIFKVRNAYPHNLKKTLSFFGLQQNQYITKLKIFPSKGQNFGIYCQTSSIIQMVQSNPKRL